MGQMGQHWCVLFLILLWFQCAISGGDKEALLGLKSSIDPSNSLHWNGNNFCKWDGVRECLRGRVSKLVLENLNLKGTLDSRFLNQLDQIRVLSFKQNSIFGKIPDLSGLKNLKSVYFSYNNFSGEFPASLTTLHRLKTIVLSGNHLSGEIPDSLLNVKRLYAFYVDDNNFTESPPEKKSDTAAVTAASGSGGGGGVASGSGKNGGSGFAAEGDEGVGKLVFFFAGDSPEMSYSLEDLLKASAETLGRGTVGSTYKAVMESGFIVTVKRLKDARYPRVEEFRRHVDVIGRLRHQNLVPLRAYFQAKEERLLVYDYFPNGSLFSLIHGSRTSAGGKPLHWTSCLKIAEDLATGLLYIHQNPGLTHGNLKSSNVLLGSDFESCLTDYGLMSFRNPDFPEESSASSLFYRAPECRDPRKPITQQADVYSFGVLLLELLTGKTPYQDLVLEHGSDIPKWVKSVRDEETESGDEPTSSGNETSEEKLTALLNIAMACISLVPENRPVMKEVLRMIRETRAEAAHVSSNSSDHSPGRWSDTVQSLPRDEHLSI
ncbi:putative protein kinase RLK-Pelle-LRR-III family [Helianthus annuus]|uniref:inactive leucine-rich repeat receptor-like serine/threonine-protein kinase At1g60630 isoform X3 n=1 Tax=Helianthus annuus TaxID=4232 RepID=UPI000B903B15|nr:inactive leucine-rich repeat receptor-like serine/threonine-protein kinase At1g60630 isoform X3 [Helianthus annuus]KAJ0560242.1 putative protein kinase RLK-Pelle-LRR-III family [Helianthus annuus]KAJ0573248.1 putative protein kinase RLK-Pelle-LRR-III family [Helianthus annuus]KAJ0737663.1 putative protein kinase RLK-Pelle-LRR-III family [Helianthus annuus]KAJ0740539.1 putative protein kinase RLK-Pelle-LRR-III family [Helianthus annuus]